MKKLAIQYKIFSGVAVLFAANLLLCLLSIYVITQFARQSRGTLIDNYRTMDYALNMLTSFDNLYWAHIRSGNSPTLDQESATHLLQQTFEQQLQLETRNITEPGEADLVNAVHAAYREYLHTTETFLTQSGAFQDGQRDMLRDRYLQVKQAILAIYQLNMTAIAHKHQQTENTVDKVVLAMSVVVLVSTVITLSFLVTVPTQIVKPLTTFYKERDAAKTNLLATASHELNTPLSSIHLSLKLLADPRLGALNDEQKNLLEALRQQSQRLSRVIKDLLAYTQIETGKIQLKFEAVQPHEVVNLAITAVTLSLSEKQIELHTEVAEGLPAIRADLEKTVWVLVNLLSNAIRYSKSNAAIRIVVTTNHNAARFSVTDYGPGIAPEHQQRLFQRFVQVGQKSPQGWGLGLAIAKEFVQAQGGEIRVESEPGKGSTFSFTLPTV